MVLTPFEWPYGGHQVFLCGSFTGWTKQEQMILVEGSSSNFRIIRDLPPGFYQYKFLVDGIWRFDERKHCIQDDYGTVNNIVLVKEPELIPQLMHTEAFQSSTEIEVSRRRLSSHLLFYKIFELIPDSGKGLAVVPLWDAPSRQISGMLTASDFIFILEVLFSNELLDMRPISAWKEGKLLLHPHETGSSLLVSKRPLIQVGPDESLGDVARRILQNNVSTVPVLYMTQNGSGAQLLHIACLAGILRLGSLPLGTWKSGFGRTSGHLLLTLRPTDLFSSALSLLLQAQVSSIPIVGDDGALLNVFSRSDITTLAKDSVYAHVQLDRTTISQVLELVNGTHDRYSTCKRTDSLYSVMELLSDPVVGRIIVTNADCQVEGIITLRDVFNFILN